MSIAVQIDYVLLVVMFFLLVIALLSIATGKSPLPASIRRRLRRVPESPYEQRKLGIGQALIAFGAMANLGVMLLWAPPNTALTPRVLDFAVFLVGPATMLICFVAAVVILFTVRYVDRRDGVVASLWDHLSQGLRSSAP